MVMICFLLLLYCTSNVQQSLHECEGNCDLSWLQGQASYTTTNCREIILVKQRKKQTGRLSIGNKTYHKYEQNGSYSTSRENLAMCGSSLSSVLNLTASISRDS